MNYQFRKASILDKNQIWEILQQAILRRKNEGSQQWQDGYPNLEIIQNDIENGVAFVLHQQKTIVGYCAIMINNEPAYSSIDGKWQSDSDFVVFHRIAISEPFLKKGLSKIILQNIETFALKNHIYSIKADTNFDNIAMLHIFEKLGYVYCGEVFFRGFARKAFEKVLLDRKIATM